MARTRQDWIDALRGVALTGVVVHHVILALTAQHGPTEPIDVSEPILTLNAVLDGFRMPTLVALSGLLAAAIGTWTWADVLRRRVGPLVVMYAAWAIVLTAATLALLGTQTHVLRELGSAAWLPFPQLWYLAALPVYIALAYVTRSLPTWVLVSASLAVFLVARLLWTETAGLIGTWAWVASHWVYFVCAQRLARGYANLAQAATWRRAISALAVFVAIAGIAVALSIESSPLMLVPLSIAGTLAGIVCAGVWGGEAWLGWARAVGRRSLGVYASHALIATALWMVLDDLIPSFPGGGAVVPVLLSGVTLATAYWLTVALARWAPVPLVRPWWDTSAREAVTERRDAGARAT